MHLLPPITQAVGNHLDDTWIRKIDSISRAGVVDVEALLLGKKTIIACVIDTFERQGRTLLVAFSGVIVDHIQDDFEPGRVEARTISLNSRRLLGISEA
jgi:hypothetical protein